MPSEVLRQRTVQSTVLQRILTQPTYETRFAAKDSLQKSRRLVEESGVAMRSLTRLLVLWTLAPLVGCTSLPQFQENPATIAHHDYDYVWNKTIEVVERYFEVAYENRYDGRIRTLPQTAATLFEPWYRDSVDFEERLHASLQSIRRRAFVRVERGPTGAFLISVEIYKELEDLHQPIYASFGRGTFIQSIEPVREELVTSAIKPANGWISLGRDLKLEARILDEIRKDTEAW